MTSAALLVTTGCGGDDDGDTLQVFAAASLTDVFADLEREFESRRPDVDVALNLAGSSSLREQILEGAPADVVATADLASIEPLRDADLVEGVEVFASNRLAIGVPAGNAGGVTGLESFAEPAFLVGACQGGVPCGDLADLVFEAADVDPALDTEEPNVRALLTKIGSGDLDAGIVYRTDVASTPDVEAIEIPADLNVVNDYPIAVVRDPEGDGLPNGPTGPAADFVAFVLSDAGRALLAERGFDAP